MFCLGCRGLSAESADGECPCCAALARVASLEKDRDRWIANVQETQEEATVEIERLQRQAATSRETIRSRMIEPYRDEGHPVVRCLWCNRIWNRVTLAENHAPGCLAALPGEEDR